MNQIIKSIETSYLKVRETIPIFKYGDTVRVHLKVREGDKERLQAFEGIVISIRRGHYEKNPRKGEENEPPILFTNLKENFTLRKISYGIGVERTFLLHSPNITDIQIIRHGKVARAKLYYLRNRVGKQTRVRDKIMTSQKEG
ncbi:50S ribosomal protein L19 [bacterium]|nr:50S ribosomal protein L19 [bacterium]